MKNLFIKIIIICLLICLSVLSYLLLYKLIDLEVFASIIGAVIGVFGTWYVTDHTAKKEIEKILETDEKNKMYTYMQINKSNAKSIYTALSQYSDLITNIHYLCLYQYNHFNFDAFDKNEIYDNLSSINVFLKKLKIDFYYDDKLVTEINKDIQISQDIQTKFFEANEPLFFICTKETILELLSYSSSTLNYFNFSTYINLEQLSEFMLFMCKEYKNGQIDAKVIICLFEELKKHGNLQFFTHHILLCEDYGIDIFEEQQPSYRTNDIEISDSYFLSLDLEINPQKEKSIKTEYATICFDQNYKIVDLIFHSNELSEKYITQILANYLMTSGKKYREELSTSSIYYI